MADTSTMSTDSATGMKSSIDSSVISQMEGLGLSDDKITAITSALGNYSIESSPIKTILDSAVETSEADVEDDAQREVDEEAEDSTATKNQSNNGSYADQITEPKNSSVVSSPKDIPNNTSSFKEDHPYSFGYKDRGGNYQKYNILSGLYQRGLKNGLKVRSDVQGNTTLFIPANFKVKAGQTLNINAGDTDIIMTGSAHIESTSDITIKAPAINLIGAVTIDGTQVNTSTITAAGTITAPNVIGSVNGVFGGISSIAHGHTQGNDSGDNSQQTTNTPVNL